MNAKTVEPLSEAEYRLRYRARLIAAGCLPGLADDATDAAEIGPEQLADGDPEADADDEMSYWSDESP